MKTAEALRTIAMIATVGFFLFLAWLAYLDVRRIRAAEEKEKSK